ncbi:hypothetical protein [Tateyamaria sp. syn59]|uniref:hypothetical protein n=1 Tax=Tateyamaria sp. syn59 TaxID=2576942 RepID=UPI0011BE07A7|nr:hypothetical protein [Tateyamaria sp. syn59]
MPNIAFSGFSAGSTVTIGGVTVNAWGQVANGETVWDRPAAPGTSVEINIQRSEHQVAPEGMMFDVTLNGFDTDTLPVGQYDPSYHDKVIFWDFGEDYTFEAPTKVADMDTADGGNRTSSRYMRGPLGAHTYRSADTFTVRVAVLEPSSGKWGQGVATVTVGDPDSFYRGTATLFVDPSGSFANAPGGALQFTSIRDAWNVMANARRASRIVLERGQDYTISPSDISLYQPSGAASVSLRMQARPSTGPSDAAKPVVQATGFAGQEANVFYDNSVGNSASASSGTVFSDIDFRGQWNAINESGVRLTFYQVASGGSGPTSVTFDACNFTGWGITLYGSDWPSGRGVTNRVATYNDCTITEWGGYGILEASQSSHAITGCRIAQNPNAQAGGDRTNEPNAPIRITDPWRSVISACDLFSLNGWARWGGISATQPCVRWNTSARHAGARLNVQSCAMEAAWTPLSINSQNAGTARNLVNALVEGCILIAGFQSRAIFEVSHGGSTIRNNMAIFAPVSHNSGSIGGFNAGIQGGFLWMEGGGQGNPANERTPVLFYNNTLVNLTDIVAAEVRDSIGFSSVTPRNNLIHAPALGAQGRRYAPMTAIRAFEPRYLGYRNSSTPLATQFAHPTDMATIWMPALNSPALGEALTEPNAHTDFRGDLRPEPASFGATEVG